MARQRNPHHHVEHVIERSLQEAFVGRYVGEKLDRANAVFLFGLTPVAIARIGLAHRVMRHATEHRYPVPRPDPLAAVFIGARGRCVHLRREIMRKKQNMHSTHCPSPARIISCIAGPSHGPYESLACIRNFPFLPPLAGTILGLYSIIRDNRAVILKVPSLTIVIGVQTKVNRVEQQLRPITSVAAVCDSSFYTQW